MDSVTFSIGSIIILIAAAQGFFLVTLLAGKGENASANRWIAALIGVVSVHLLEYACDISGITLRYPALMGVTYPLLFCMGPLYFGYVRLLLGFNLGGRFWLHFIPALGMVLVMMPFYLMDPASKSGSMRDWSEDGEIRFPVEQLIFMGLHLTQTIVYVVAAGSYLRRRSDWLQRYTAQSDLISRIKWTRGFGLVFQGYLFVYGLGIITLSLLNRHQFEVDYSLLLVTAILIYVFGYAAYRHPSIRAEVLFAEQKLTMTSGVDTGFTERVPLLREQLLKLMEREKPYLKQDLRISDLAGEMAIPAYQLSQLINETLGENFYDFVNRYRISEAKQMLTRDNGTKMLAIAYDVGFNSKATFNRVFKKLTGITPSEYRDGVDPARPNVSTAADPS